MESLTVGDFEKKIEKVTENKFWQDLRQNKIKNISYAQDNCMSLFKDDSLFNLTKLDDYLSNFYLHKKLNHPGINKTYVNFGSAKSVFPIHREDFDLYAINYLHFGEAK